MDEVRKLADKIVSDYEITTKAKTDKLLQLDAIQYTNLGTDSTKTEKQAVKSNSKYIYRQIKEIDEPLGKQLIKAMDA